MEELLDREISDEELEQMLQRVRSADQFNASASGDEQTTGEEEVLTDEFGFPFEPEGLYNSAPIEFEEIARDLWNVLSATNYTATRYNRLSPYYAMLMQRLEKDIKQMGSYCITKAVLEASGQEFSDLAAISVKELYQMVSVHFRKCCLAYNDLQESGKGMDMTIISWMFRWAALAERLKVTQEKINNIQSGKIKIETLLAKETVYKGEPHMQQDHSPHLVGPRVRASSLPILKSFTGEVKTRRREEEKQERALRRASERARKRLEREADNVPGGFKPAVFRPKPLPKHPETGLNIRQLRQLLMDEAKARGDIAEAGIIAQESEQQLLERFQILQRSAQGNADPPRRDVRSGPSNETRKKLREKRKKAKR